MRPSVDRPIPPRLVIAVNEPRDRRQALLLLAAEVGIHVQLHIIETEHGDYMVRPLPGDLWFHCIPNIDPRKSLPEVVEVPADCSGFSVWPAASEFDELAEQLLLWAQAKQRASRFVCIHPELVLNPMPVRAADGPAQPPRYFLIELSAFCCCCGEAFYQSPTMPAHLSPTEPPQLALVPGGRLEPTEVLARSLENYLRRRFGGKSLPAGEALDQLLEDFARSHGLTVSYTEQLQVIKTVLLRLAVAPLSKLPPLIERYLQAFQRSTSEVLDGGGMVESKDADTES